MRVPLFFIATILAAQSRIDYDAMAGRIAAALKLQPGERVLMRYDPDYFAGLKPPLEARVRAAKAVLLEPLRAQVPLAERLDGADVYLWLPLGNSARQLSAEEQELLVRWLQKGGARREIHFHWSEGTRRPDGLPAAHPPGFDALYQSALDIDYGQMKAAQDRVIEILRLGTVRVSTPAGTDLLFRIGERPFNRQDGDASGQRARAAKVRVDREIELPAGVVRVAPVEESVAGNLVIPEARFGDTVARKVVFQIDNGRITRVTAEQGLDAVKAALAAGGEDAQRFREFGLGFNPKLAVPAGSPLVPYYGYGAGVVRVSLGDNEELGGAVRGKFVRWFFLTDATVHVDFRYLVRNGMLVAPPGR